MLIWDRPHCDCEWFRKQDVKHAPLSQRWSSDSLNNNTFTKVPLSYRETTVTSEMSNPFRRGTSLFPLLSPASPPFKTCVLSVFSCLSVQQLSQSLRCDAAKLLRIINFFPQTPQSVIAISLPKLSRTLMRRFYFPCFPLPFQSLLIKSCWLA